MHTFHKSRNMHIMSEKKKPRRRRHKIQETEDPTKSWS